MDIMHRRSMERSTPNLVPIKSSLSFILGDVQVWSNTVCASADFMSGNLNSVEDPDKLDVFAQRLAARKDDAQESVKRMKKSRQVFTYSQPPVAGIVADFTGKDIEVYECIGGQDMGLFCGMEPHLCEEFSPKQLCQHQPSSVRHVPDGVTPQTQGSDRTIHQSPRDSTASEISYPMFALPQKVRSECELKTCFPSPVNPSLFYTVSDSSLPILKRSSLVFSRVSSQRMPVHFLDAGLGENVIPPKTFVPVYGIRPSCSWFDESKLKRLTYDLTLGRSILINPYRKDILIKCKNMDDALARKIAETIRRVTGKARRGKFMNYAKFSSSFKLSEVFYEDINSRCLSHVPSLVPSFHLSGLIHKVNPDFDENQSISEAMTAMKSLSTVTSVSRITKMCRVSSSANSKTSRQALKCDWIKSTISSEKMNCKPTEYLSGILNRRHDKAVEFSSISANSGVSLAHVVTAARKQQLSKLQESLRSACPGGQKETDIWSSSTSTGYKEVRAAPKRLVDVISPSCIFRASVMDGQKPPVWQLKSDKPGRNFSTDLVNDFIFKAHNYMQVKDRPNSHHCFFQQQPTYRVVDEGVQFPDVALTWDRSSNVKEPLSENHILVHKDILDVLSRPTKDKVDQESSTVIQSEMDSSTVNNVRPENQSQPHLTNLNVIVACDKPFYSTSEFQTGSSDQVSPNLVAVPRPGTEKESSMDLPASTSSNKCQGSSSEYHTTATAASLQPRNRKLVLPKLEPVAEHLVPKCCKARNRRLPEASQFCRSYRAICDKRKIKIKYENGRYTVLKEMDRSKRQTVWSIITGKATHLLNKVVHRKPHVRRASGR